MSSSNSSASSCRRSWRVCLEATSTTLEVVVDAMKDQLARSNLHLPLLEDNKEGTMVAVLAQQCEAKLQESDDAR